MTNPSPITPEKLELHRKWLDGEPDGVRLSVPFDANLRGANLRGADLSDADLSGADLRGADLSRADLSRADLRDANLSRADLSDANLRDANLSGADLRDADLSGADLRGGAVGGHVNGLTPEMLGLPPADPDLPRRVASAALQPGALDNSAWHTCETTHCLAGWAIHLSGPAGYALEKLTSPSVAGAILMPSAQHLFYASTDEARAWLEEQAKKPASPERSEAG